MSVTEQQVIGAIRRHTDESTDGWVASGPLVRYLGASRMTIARRLGRLMTEGTVERRGAHAHTKYRLADRSHERGRGPATVTSLTRHAPGRDDLSPLRPVGNVLRTKIASLLRQEARLPLEIAKNLVVSRDEVIAEIGVLRQLGERGEGPKVLKHASGAYLIDEDEARAWGMPA